MAACVLEGECGGAWLGGAAIPKGLLSGRCVVGMALALGRHLSVYLRPL